VLRIVAVNWVGLTKVVFRKCPFHCTVAPGTKLDPFTVNMKLGPPGATLAGVS
jgi:hypothetical protein